jgi:serine/threonine-protein kinase
MSALHQHAKDVFLEALARPANEREAFVAQACGTDRVLREEVNSLLAFHSEHNSEDDGSGSRPAATPSHAGAAMPFVPGDVFAGRYRMITRIGRGGMGDVWRADDLILETPVALKLIQGRGEEARLRILNEVRLARQITDPAVCRVFDVGEADGRVFFSMELVRGEDLASLLRRVGRLPSERVIEIAHQLCAGLAAAHAQGVLHRDLKPANVLIDDTGSVRITDFGIAVSRTDTARHTLTGTPGYMAPEQLRPGA